MIIIDTPETKITIFEQVLASQFVHAENSAIFHCANFDVIAIRLKNTCAECDKALSYLNASNVLSADKVVIQPRPNVNINAQPQRGIIAPGL